MDAITEVPRPVNEPNLHYAPGSPERAELEAALVELQKTQLELTATIGGEKVSGGGAEIAAVQPHNHQHVLGTMRNATQKDAKAAIAAATEAAPQWRAMAFDDRAAILLKAADL